MFDAYATGAGVMQEQATDYMVETQIDVIRLETIVMYQERRIAHLEDREAIITNLLKFLLKRGKDNFDFEDDEYEVREDNAL
jgi:hypothetical protein